MSGEYPPSCIRCEEINKKVQPFLNLRVEDLERYASEELEKLSSATKEAIPLCVACGERFLELDMKQNAKALADATETLIKFEQRLEKIIELKSSTKKVDAEVFFACTNCKSCVEEIQRKYKLVAK